MRVETTFKPPVESDMARCVDCDMAVWLARSTPKYSDAKLLCLECLLDRVRDTSDDNDVEPITKEQIADLLRQQ